MYQVIITNLFKNGKYIAKLTATEARVLDYFINNSGQTFSAEHLAKKVNSYSPNYIRNTMSKLIKQLNLPVETVLRQGWRWVESEVKSENK